MTNIPGPIGLQNRERLRKWIWKWHLQGGCFHWTARDLTDLRNDELRERGRAIEAQVREVRRSGGHKKVANIARLRIERAKRIRA